MFKVSRSSNSSSDFFEVTGPGGLGLHVRLHHEDSSVSLRVHDAAEVRAASVTICPQGLGPSIGAALTLDDGDEHPLQASLFLGPLSLYFSARSYYGRRDEKDRARFVDPPGLLRRIVHALVGENRRRRTSLTLDYHDPETVEGRELRLRACLWDDDTSARMEANRQWSLSLTHLLWGEPKHARDRVIEERDVVVAFPEGAYPMTARLMERRITWPRWPLQKLYRWVDFWPAAMLVPERKGDDLNYAGDTAGVAHVTGRSFSAAIGELVRRVTRDREHYGGRSWTPRPTPHHRESHRVAFTWEKPRAGRESLVGGDNLFHGRALYLVSTPGELTVAELDGHDPSTLIAELRRDPADGGVHLTRIAKGVRIAVDGVQVDRWAKLWQRSVVEVGAHVMHAHFHPIGPPAPDEQLELVASSPAEDSIVTTVAEVAATLDTSTPAAVDVEPPPAWIDDELGDLVDPPEALRPAVAPPMSRPEAAGATKWSGD